MREILDPCRSVLAASICYSWDGDFPGQNENIGAIFRCGELTDAGRLALSQM